MAGNENDENPNGAGRSRGSAMYRAVWRWHFYAGLLALPFLVLLAVTGGIYLFQDEFNAWYYSDWRTVEVPDHPRLPAGVLVERAEAKMPGKIRRITLAGSPDSAMRVFSTTAPGRRFDGYTGYVNPYTGEVLGVTTGGVMELVRGLHSLSYFGFLANCLIEIVAGWTLMLVATGLFLWWPRGRGLNALKVRGKPDKRMFWRDFHAVTGAVAGLLIAFLSMSGMPWSPVWGQGLHTLVAETGLGRPLAPESSPPMVTHAEHLGETGWTLDSMPVPESRGGGRSIRLEQAIARFEALGFSGSYRIALPQRPTGVYSASVGGGRGGDVRVVHLDQYTGEVIADLHAEDFGLGSRVIGWAVGVHLGDLYGLANQLVMLAGCIAIVLLAVSAPVMWWKRRPRGTLGVPPEPRDPRKTRVVFGMIVVGGIVFPLVGLSIVAMTSLDWAVRRVFRSGRGDQGRVSA